MREKLRVGLRQVQTASLTIAKEENDRRFYISAARLDQIENDTSIPSVYKLFTLCSVYSLDFLEVLSRYGVNANRTHDYRGRLLSGITRPISGNCYHRDTKITIPVKLDPTFRWEATQLLNRIVALWGEVPASFLLNFHPRTHVYGYIGLTDYTMYPLIHPGAIVLVDPHRRRVESEGWHSEFSRPIYFIEMREGYCCAWCQVEGSHLTIIPNPASSVRVREVNLYTDAEIIGQVVAVAMRLAPVAPPSPEHSPVPEVPAESATGRNGVRPANIR